MKSLKLLFENNEQWVEQKTSSDPDYFKKLAFDHEPEYLWIGCSDSRVPANEIIGLEPGKVFVHRNVANLVSHTDFSCLSVLEFAVQILKVEHIIVCGHYGCNGVKSAMEDHNLGLVDNWLRNIRDVYTSQKEKLESIEDLELRYKALVELNVEQQVLNICHTTIVQKAWANQQPLHVHGWVYDLETGLLKDLNLCLTSSEQLDSIYRIKIKKLGNV